MEEYDALTQRELPGKLPASPRDDFRRRAGGTPLEQINCRLEATLQEEVHGTRAKKDQTSRDSVPGRRQPRGLYGRGAQATPGGGARALRDSRPERYLRRGDLCPLGLVRALEERPRGGCSA